MSTPAALTPTSYVLLGLLSRVPEATPYELKTAHAGSVGAFWSIPHSQLYLEPDRLVGARLATVRREEGGRRRKHYAITDRGREALARWLEDPGTPPAEMREPALLKLFFGADPTTIAPDQLDAHRARLEEYRRLRDALAGSDSPMAAGALLTLEAGIAHAEVSLDFWRRLAGDA